MAEIHGARNVYPTPTFDQIVKDLQGEKGDKHIRFSKKKELHVHKGATSGGKPSGVGKDAAQKRATKQSDGARIVKDAIKNQYGDKIADAIFNHPGRHGADLNKGVTVKDLRDMQNTIETLTGVKSFMPTEMTLVQTKTGLQAHKELRLSDDSATKAHDHLSQNVASFKRSQNGPVVDQFEKDVGRFAMRLHDSNTPKVSGERLAPTDGMASLKRFAGGNDTVTENLSRFLTQFGPRAVATRIDSDRLLLNDGGQRLKLAIEGTPDVDTQKIDVTKDGDDFVIEYQTDNRCGMINMDADLKDQLLEANSTDLRLQLSLKIRISRDDLLNGNLRQFRIEEPPTARVEINL